MLGKVHTLPRDEEENIKEAFLEKKKTKGAGEPNGWRERKFQAMGTRDEKNQEEEGPWPCPQGQQVPAPRPLSGRGSRAPVVESLHPKIKQKREQHPKRLSTSY